jgi:hypothetical protein
LGLFLLLIGFSSPLFSFFFGERTFQLFVFFMCFFFIVFLFTLFLFKVVLEGVCSVRLPCFCFVYCFTSYFLLPLALFMYNLTFKAKNADVSIGFVFFYIVTADNFLHFY